ncbi:hypothetical protein E2C01_027774 [Portunus trituberculatus]|uniref:Uncharacterized protein n=1 Tax=Portunus trituberculatus TaxID=210409 RepID=A0A5B7EM81_PORTR|nr:hypothetical protein [Portunus trituberculatus]
MKYPRKALISKHFVSDHITCHSKIKISNMASLRQMGMQPPQVHHVTTTVMQQEGYIVHLGLHITMVLLSLKKH